MIDNLNNLLLPNMFENRLQVIEIRVKHNCCNQTVFYISYSIAISMLLKPHLQF